MNQREEEDAKQKAMKSVLDSIRGARSDLETAVEDESKIRDTNFLWKTYVKVELSIGIAKLVVGSTKLGSFKEVRVSKFNDPEKMPVSELKRKILEVISDLEYAEYDFETLGSAQGLEAARKARDALKVMLLGHRRALRPTGVGPHQHERKNV